MEQITAQTTAIEVSLEEQLKSLIQSEDLVAELSASQLALVGGGGGIASFD